MEVVGMAGNGRVPPRDEDDEGRADQVSNL